MRSFKLTTIAIFLAIVITGCGLPENVCPTGKTCLTDQQIDDIATRAAQRAATVKGESGEKGETGPRGKQGPKGEDGIDGANGKDAEPLYCSQKEHPVFVLLDTVLEGINWVSFYSPPSINTAETCSSKAFKLSVALDLSSPINGSVQIFIGTEKDIRAYTYVEGKNLSTSPLERGHRKLLFATNEVRYTHSFPIEFLRRYCKKQTQSANCELKIAIYLQNTSYGKKTKTLMSWSYLSIERVVYKGSYR